MHEELSSPRLFKALRPFSFMYVSCLSLHNQHDLPAPAQHSLCHIRRPRIE